MYNQKQTNTEPFNAQWLLYTPPGVKTSLSFCPHSVFVCYAQISEQTSIISLYNLNRLVFITEMECVYCAVLIGSLNKTDYVSFWKGQLAQQVT